MRAASRAPVLVLRTFCRGAAVKSADTGAVGVGLAWRALIRSTHSKILFYQSPLPVEPNSATTAPMSAGSPRLHHPPSLPTSGILYGITISESVAWRT